MRPPATPGPAAARPADTAQSRAAVCGSSFQGHEIGRQGRTAIPANEDVQVLNRLGYVAAAVPDEISSGRVAWRAAPGSVEIRLPFLVVAQQDIGCAGRGTIGKRLGMQPGSDGFDVR